MPVKKNSIAYYARQVRDAGKRRIKRLEKAIVSESATQRTKSWAERQIANITEAIEGTYKRSNGVTRSAGEIAAGLTRLSKAVSQVTATYELSGDPFEVTQKEINKASVGAPSAYTKNEVKVFYRVTQEIWQNGSSEKKVNRNEVILDYVNLIRKQNNLTPLTLDQVVDYIISTHGEFMKQVKIDSLKDMTPEQREAAEKAMENDNADSNQTSPITAEQAMIMTEDAFSNLLVMPDFTIE